MTPHSPFRYFKISPEIILLAVMPYVRLPPSARNVEDLFHERGIDADITRIVTFVRYNERIHRLAYETPSNARDACTDGRAFISS